MSSPPVALLLAAGVGSRLGPREPLPKVLLRFGGKSLLRRHLEALEACGIEELVIGVGHRAEAIESEAAALACAVSIRTVRNPFYTEGSVVTLAALLDDPGTAGRDVLVMDADVLYDPAILERLVRSPHPSCCLLDRDLEPTDEPVKLRLRRGRPVELRKRPDPAVMFDVQGESVGFFRFDAATADELRAAVHAYLGERRDAPHEDAIRDLVLAGADGPRGPIGVEDVTGLPWIEIDFAQDVVRAEREVLPRLPGVAAATATTRPRADRRGR